MGRAARHNRRTRMAASMPQGGASMSAYDGASHTDLALSGWNPGMVSPDAALLPELDTLSSRSLDLARNNGLMSGAMQTKRDNIIGAVLRLAATPDYRLLGWTPERAREWGNMTEAHFRSWADTTECDAARSLNLLGLSLQALSMGMLAGDAVALPLWKPISGMRWNTRLSMIHPARLSTPPGMEGQQGLRKGIEFDRDGAPVAYHFQKVNPGDGIYLNGEDATRLTQWERVPAYTSWGRRRVLHLSDKENTGQSRGKPIVAAVMREFHMAGKYSQNELQASLANSLVAAFLESDLDQDSASALFGDNPREQWAQSVSDARSIGKLQGAAVIPLPAGAKLSTFTPGRPNAAFEAFMLAVLRHIAAGMNMPYELLLKDFSKSNYSSARAALLEAWRYFHGRRRWLVDYWLRPIYELWLEEAVNAGVVDAPDFYENRYAYTRCRFIFGGRGYVDPVKEAQASAMRMANGLSTMEQECAEQGLDYEEVLDQQQIEQQMRAARGLPPLGGASRAQPAREERDEEAAQA